ncbi:MAG: hypothetical protein AAGC55_02925 [Myxococcota bacterium]
MAGLGLTACVAVDEQTNALDDSASASGDYCPFIVRKGIMSLDFNPGFLHVDSYRDASSSTGEARREGLTISSFFNAFVVPGGNPPVGFFERDLVARIPDIGRVDLYGFDPATDVEELTDLAPGQPKMVWPNEAVRAPDGVFPFEAVVIPQGFLPTPFPGRLTAIDLDDPMRTEYVIHQSTQDFGSGYTFPGDPNNSPRFYHRVLFIDMDGDGLEDIVTVRSGMRVAPSAYPPFSELVYFKNPGAAIDPETPWDEVVLYGGPAAEFLGPDIHVEAFDFEGDGIPELVTTHFFTGFPAAPGEPPPQHGKITLYGAPVGGTWADVDASAFALPRIKDLSSDQGYPFDIQVVDLNRDGRVDILATNHQPDNCSPMTASEVPGRVYALEQPESGAIFEDDWTTRILLDDIRPNPSLAPVQAPGRLAPGRAQTFYPVRYAEDFAKPWIIVGGDEASKVWILEPRDILDSDDWEYNAAVVFDINDFYGPGTTQTPMSDPFGITISTIGGVAVRYDEPGPYAAAEIYIPVFEGKEIHVLSYRPNFFDELIRCPEVTPLECPAQ